MLLPLPLVLTDHALARLRERWPHLSLPILNTFDRQVINKQADGDTLIRLEGQGTSMFLATRETPDRVIVITFMPDDFEYSAWMTPRVRDERRERLRGISDKHADFRASMKSALPRAGGGCRKPSR